jgi:hypothetical protein
MPIDPKELKAGLAFFQDGKRVAKPSAGNYAVRPVAGGQFVKANGQEVTKELRDLFKGCLFLWLSKPFDAKASKEPAQEEPKQEEPKQEAVVKKPAHLKLPPHRLRLNRACLPRRLFSLQSPRP